MTQLPARTGITDLTDDQLLLFDFLWDCYVPRRFLDSGSYSIHMNVAYSHGLTGKQIDRTIEQMFERNLITCRESCPDAFTLTPKGGAIWEAERQPDWSRYIAEHGSHNDRRLSLVTVSEDVGRHYIGGLFAAGLIVPTDRIKCRTIGNHWLTTWKRVSVAKLLRVQIRGDEPTLFIDWPVYESCRNWWRNITELNTLRSNAG